MDWRGKKLFVEECPVCWTEINYFEDLENAPNACRPEDDTIMCDAGDGDGCFRTYHKECFDKHNCKVHPGEVLIMDATESEL
jgi:hypothetical protein